MMLTKLIDVLGIQKIVVADVGARWGADKKWGVLGDAVSLVSFEPDPEEYRRLSQANTPNVTLIPVALSKSQGTATLHVAQEPGRSSLYQPNTSFLSRYPDCEGFEVDYKVEVQTDTLDHCLTARGISVLDFIKLDVQGSELNIIQGGRDILQKSVFGLEIEVEFSELYQGQPLFPEVDAACKAAGFVLFDLKPCYWKRRDVPMNGVGQMVCGDALYFKDYIQHNITPDPRAASAAIVLAVVYKKYDYALELLEFFRAKGIYSEDACRRASAVIHQLSRLVFPLNRKFRGRLRMANILGRFSQLLKTAYWARWDDWQA